MKSTDQKILLKIEQELEKKLSNLSSEDDVNLSYIDNIVKILDLTDHVSEEQIIEAMEVEDPELAGDLKKCRSTIGDVNTHPGNNVSCNCDNRAGGVEGIIKILNLADRTLERQIFKALEDKDPELVYKIMNCMFIFEDIVMLDDRSLQKMMREVHSFDLCKALKGADAEVRDKIFRNMSKRAANMLKKDIEYMGPIMQKSIYEAQQKIVSIIHHLENCGEIVIYRSISL